MLENRRGLEPKTECAERAGLRHAHPTYEPKKRQPKLRENSRVTRCGGKILFV
jgi:hypothetical protein